MVKSFKAYLIGTITFVILLVIFHFIYKMAFGTIMDLWTGILCILAYGIADELMNNLDITLQIED